MPDPAPEPAATATPNDPNQSPAWQSYLMPGTDVLRTVAELTNPVAVALFERMVSADAETTLRRNTDRPRSLDLAHLSNIHEQLFADVYPFAGQLRYVDMGKPGQTGEPFLHHRWIETYTAAVTEQLRAQDNLAGQSDPGQWADRAAYYWAAVLHAHPFREGNGRSARIWVEDLAAVAGHDLDWTRSSPDRNVHVAMAAGHGDYEPMRALLTVVAGGTVGVDRQVEALDDFDKLQTRAGVGPHRHGLRQQHRTRHPDHPAGRARRTRGRGPLSPRLPSRARHQRRPTRRTALAGPGRVDLADPPAHRGLATLCRRAGRGRRRGHRRRHRTAAPGRA